MTRKKRGPALPVMGELGKSKALTGGAKMGGGRKCGPCTLCCTAMAVPELSKPAGVECEHVTPTGCGIYDERPASCASFACLWLRGVDGLDRRPDRTRAVIAIESAGPKLREFPSAVVLYTVPGEKLTRYASRFVERTVKKGGTAFVVAGLARRMFTPPGSIFYGRVLPEAVMNDAGEYEAPE
jgi:hypothetical protein